MRKGLTITFAFLVLLAGSVFAWRARVQRQVVTAKAFCESLLPNIQKARSASGSYPVKVDAEWWTGRQVPALVRTQDFYLSDGSTFLLRFRDPSAFWDDVWGFDSRWMGWMNYDGY